MFCLIAPQQYMNWLLLPTSLQMCKLTLVCSKHSFQSYFKGTVPVTVRCLGSVKTEVTLIKPISFMAPSKSNK
jgi:hypothetical protein